MVVTNNGYKIARDPEDDAKLIVDAIRHSPKWDVKFWDIASQYNGHLNILIKSIYREAVANGLGGMRVLAGLFKVYRDFEERMKRETNYIPTDGQANNIEDAYKRLAQIPGALEHLTNNTENGKNQALSQEFIDGIEARVSDLFREVGEVVFRRKEISKVAPFK